MTWNHMAIKLGLGRRFAFARLQRWERCPAQSSVAEPAQQHFIYAIL